MVFIVCTDNCQSMLDNSPYTFSVCYYGMGVEGVEFDNVRHTWVFVDENLVV